MHFWNPPCLVPLVEVVAGSRTGRYRSGDHEQSGSPLFDDRSDGVSGFRGSGSQRGEYGAKTGRGFYDWSKRNLDEITARQNKRFIDRLIEMRKK
jgi:3-hydroxyacyl-CoA dehydrogenase